MKITNELARIHAHLCGDGHISTFKTSEKDRINRSEIVYTNMNPRLINEFRSDMKRIFGVKMSLGSKNNVKVSSIRIANELLKFGDYKSRCWRIPEEIKMSPIPVKLSWIKAFIEDEGHFPNDRDGIRIKCMNRLGLLDLKEILDSLNVYSNLTGPNCDDSWYLNIRKTQLLKLVNIKKEKIRR